MEHFKITKMKEKELHRGVVPFLNCKDYLVSEETYEIMLNQENLKCWLPHQFQQI